MLKLEFTDQAYEEYASWLREGNLKTADKIDALIENAQSTPYSGIGKPEALKHGLTGKWSRRITQKDRLVYEVRDDRLIIHYMKKHGLADEDLDRMAEAYERGDYPHADAPVYSGSHLDAVGKKRVTVVYDAKDTQKVAALARARGVKPSKVFRDALDYYLTAQA